MDEKWMEVTWKVDGGGTKTEWRINSRIVIFKTTSLNSTNKQQWVSFLGHWCQYKLNVGSNERTMAMAMFLTWVVFKSVHLYIFKNYTPWIKKNTISLATLCQMKLF